MRTLTPLLLALGVFLASPQGDLLDYIGIGIGQTGFSLLDLYLMILGPFIYISGGLNVSKLERRVLLSLFFVLVTRFVSLINITTDFLGHFLSVFRYLQTATIIYVFSSVAQNQARLTRLISLMMFLTTIDAAYGTWQLFFSGQRGIGLSMANWAFEGFFLSFLVLTSYSKKLKLSQVVAGLLYCSGLLATLTRSVIIVTAISIVLSTLRNLGIVRSARIVKIGMIIIISASMFTLFSAEKLEPLTQRFEVLLGKADTRMSDVRFTIWAQAIAVFWENPLFGAGSGGFSRRQQIIYDLPYWIPIEYIGDQETVETQGTHSIVLNVMAETGIVGLVAYLIWFWAVVTVCIAGFRIRKETSNEWELIYSLSTFILVNVCLDAIYPASFSLPISVMLGILLGLLTRTASAAGPTRTLNNANGLLYVLKR